ncbi:MAG: exodeoxyribonuclease VII large subunit, partial [Gammaproteobacteria bacterium]|nr:exodeoxyribonuclease VII large subunit [Gammaproteobacteria bacterium]
IIETPIQELNPTADRSVWVAGLIVAIRTLNTQRGKKMAFVTVDDNSARIDISIMGDLLNSERNTLRKDNVVAIHGQVSVDDYSGGFQMRAEKIYDIDTLRSQMVVKINIETDEQALKNGLPGEMDDMLRPYLGGGSEIVLSYQRQNGQRADIQLGSKWKVKPTEALVSLFESKFGRDKYKLIYDLRLMQNNKPAPPAQQHYLEAM